MKTFERIQNLINSPAIQLLQKENAVLILSFIFQEYKVNEKSEIQKFELIRSLESFLFDVRQKEPGKYGLKAKDYIENWQKDENPYLQTLYFDSQLNDWVIEPTFVVKKIFQWLEDLDEQKYIATEIGFLNILNTMKSIVFGTLLNPDEKLEKLKIERDKIDQQIKDIESLILSGEQMEQIDDHEIRSGYSKIIRDAKSLIHDFDLVATNYKKLKEEVKDKYNIEKLSNGAILGSYLEADKEIKETSLVKSYKAFRAYLRPDSEEILEDLIRKIHKLPQIKAIEDRFIIRLPTHLGQASKKVGLIDGEIFSWVKTIFDDEFQENAKKVYALMQEIKKSIIENKDNFPNQKKFIEIETKAQLYTHRFAYEPTTKIKFQEKNISRSQENNKEDILNELKAKFSIDEEQLQNNIKALLTERASISLPEVISNYPIKNGLPEVMAYIKIATKSNSNIIDASKTETIKYDGSFQITLPLIIYKNELE